MAYIRSESNVTHFGPIGGVSLLPLPPHPPFCKILGRRSMGGGSFLTAEYHACSSCVFLKNIYIWLVKVSKLKQLKQGFNNNIF